MTTLNDGKQTDGEVVVSGLSWEGHVTDHL